MWWIALVIYYIVNRICGFSLRGKSRSFHKPHSPIKWGTDHQWHIPGKRRGVTIMDRTTQGPPDYQLAPWAHSSRPRLTPFGTSLPIRVYPGWKVSLASWSKGTLFGQLNVRHAFNMTRGTNNDQSLTDIDGKLIATQNPVWLPPTFPFGLQLSINTWLFPDFIHSTAKAF
jgi:hypothetical protein